MRFSRASLIVFSPCGTTQASLRAVAAGLDCPVREINLTLPAARNATHTFGSDDLVLFGFPVYGGRLPHNADQVFACVTGASTPAVLVAVYGNRAYEDTLLEMQHASQSRGFIPVAGAAAVAEHSMVPEVASKRPDALDAAALSEFGRALAAYCRDLTSPLAAAFTAPGSFPYEKQPLRAASAPKGTDSCTRCGDCARICPTGAIRADAPECGDGEKCILCMACIKACPFGARVPTHPTFAQATSWLRANCMSRKEPEFFPEILRP